LPFYRSSDPTQVELHLHFKMLDTFIKIFIIEWHSLPALFIAQIFVRTELDKSIVLGSKFWRYSTRETVARTIDFYCAVYDT